MRRRVLRTARVLALAFTAASAAFADEVADAPALGLGGISALDRVDRSPGAPAPPGYRIQLGGGAPFAGSGLVEVGGALQLVRTRWGAAASLTQLASDVHRQTELDLGVQLRRHGWSCGAAVGLRELAFSRYPPFWSARMRAGLGVQAPVRVTLGVEHAPGDAPIRIVGAAAASAAPGLDLVVQVEREPGRPAGLRAGASWNLTVFEFRTGYEFATRSPAGGIAVGVGGWRLVWAARTHPDLGWSQAWTLVFHRS